jgi:hypothetical protein
MSTTLGAFRVNETTDLLVSMGVAGDNKELLVPVHDLINFDHMSGKMTVGRLVKEADFSSQCSAIPNLSSIVEVRVTSVQLCFVLESPGVKTSKTILLITCFGKTKVSEAFLEETVFSKLGTNPFD